MAFMPPISAQDGNYQGDPLFCPRYGWIHIARPVYVHVKQKETCSRRTAGINWTLSFNK